MSRVLTGSRFRLELTPTQARLAAQSDGACRWLWNAALADRETLWLAAKSAGATGLAGSVGAAHLCSLLPGWKQEKPWLSLAPNHALQQTLRDLDRAFANFFDGRAGFPCYCRRGRSSAFWFPHPKQFEVGNDGWARLPEFSWVRFRQSQPVVGVARNITLSREGQHWFMALCVAGTFELPSAQQDGVGLDAGITQDITASTGAVSDLGAPSEPERQRLARLQRRVSRRGRGSKRYQRAVAHVAKVRRYWARRRRDSAHRLTKTLATAHCFIAIEDPKLRNLTASAQGSVTEPGRNRELLARGHADVRRMLAYKCERAGLVFV